MSKQIHNYITNIFFIFLVLPNIYSQNYSIFPINFIAVDTDKNKVGERLSNFIDDRLCEINQTFVESNIVFSRRNISYITMDNLCNGCDKISSNEAKQIINDYYNNNLTETSLKNFITIWLFKDDSFTSFTDGGGFANFPGNYYNNGILGVTDDGILTNENNNIVLPYSRFFKGTTCIHEMGHFFGLYHTFQNYSNYATCDQEYCNGINTCLPSCSSLICHQESYDNNGDQIAQTSKSLSPADLIKYRFIQVVGGTITFPNYLEKSCTDLITTWRNDPVTWNNFMNYSGPFSRTNFSSEQIHIMSENRNLIDRIRLQHPVEQIDVISSSYDQTTNKYEIKWRFGDLVECIITSLLAVDKPKIQKSNSIYRLQITKNQNKYFTSKKGYKDNWNDPVNSTLVADIGIFEQNGVISFDWSDAAVDGTSVFEGPKIGETYKATLARPYLDQQGFSIFSEEIIFTIQEDYPSLNASGLFAKNTTQTTTTLNWSRGDGEKCIVIATSCGSVSTVPVDGTDYSANSNYSSASSLGNSKIVYEGSGTTVNITGLAKNSCYQFEVFEFNGTGNETKYLHSYAPKVEERTDGDFSVDFYWDPDPIVAGEYIDFDWYSSKGGLVTNNWTFQGGSPSSSNTGQNIRFFTPGTYNVTLTGTYNGASATKTRQITVVDPNDFDPDLVFSSHSLSKNPVVPNDRLTIDWTITNNGATDTRFFFNNYYYSDNNVLDANDHMYDYIASEDDYQVTVNSGASVSGNKEIKIPWDAQAGTRYIIVQLYSEGDEKDANNVLAIPITVKEEELEKLSYRNFNKYYGHYYLNGFDETSDGFIISAEAVIGNNRTRTRLIKIDKNGYTSWYRTLKDDLGALDRAYLGSIKSVSDKYFFEYTISPDNSSSIQKYLARTNKEGEVETSKQIQFIGSTINNFGFVVSGSNLYLSSQIDQNPQLTKLDQNLNVIWSKKYNENNLSLIKGLGPSIDGGIYAINNLGELVKISNSGQIEWTNKISDNINILSVFEYQGYVYVSGNMQISGIGSALIAKLNISGSNVWIKSIISPYPNVNSIQANPYESGLVLSTEKEFILFEEDGTLKGGYGLGGYWPYSFIDDIANSHNGLYAISGTEKLGNLYSVEPAIRLRKINSDYEICGSSEQLNLNVSNQSFDYNVKTSNTNISNSSISLINNNPFNGSYVEPIDHIFCGKACELSAELFITGSQCVNSELQFRFTGEGAELIEWYTGTTKIGEGVILNHSFSSSGNKTIKVVASQSNGCVVESEEIITIQNNPTITGTAHTSECDDNKGKILISVSGNSPYDYYWSNQATTEGIYNLFPDEYNVRVSDANGCSISKDFTVECFDVVSMQFDVPANMTIGQSYSIPYSVKNTGADDFSGILYYRLDNGSLVTVYSGAIASGASKGGSILINPDASVKGINVPLELLYKAYSLTSYYNVGYGEDTGLKYIDICNGRIEICDGIDNDCDGLVDEGNVCCVDQLTITSATDPLYESSQTITTNGNVDINSGQRSQFRSQAVILKPGFHTQSGSVFRANVDPCNN